MGFFGNLFKSEFEKWVEGASPEELSDAYEEKGDSKLTNRETLFFTRINDLQDYIKKQRTNLESFDETLVKRWLKQITVWEDHFTVKLKSGLKIDIEG